MFDLSPSMVWLILLVIFILTEIATVGLLTIWFAGGSLAAFFVSLTQAGTGIQIVIFLIVSFVLVLLIRPLAQKKFNSGHIRTNAQTLIGEEAVVLEPINNLRSQGRVMIPLHPLQCNTCIHQNVQRLRQRHLFFAILRCDTFKSFI